MQQQGQEGLAAGKAVSSGDFWPLDVAAAAATTFSRLNIIISITHQAVINDTQIVHECRLMMLQRLRQTSHYGSEQIHKVPESGYAHRLSI